MARDAARDLAALQREREKLERKVERLEAEAELARDAIADVVARIDAHDPSDERYQGEPGTGGNTIARAQ